MCNKYVGLDLTSSQHVLHSVSTKHLWKMCSPGLLNGCTSQCTNVMIIICALTNRQKCKQLFNLLIYWPPWNVIMITVYISCLRLQSPNTSLRPKRPKETKPNNKINGTMIWNELNTFEDYQTLITWPETVQHYERIAAICQKPTPLPRCWVIRQPPCAAQWSGPPANRNGAGRRTSRGCRGAGNLGI